MANTAAQLASQQVQQGQGISQSPHQPQAQGPQDQGPQAQGHLGVPPAPVHMMRMPGNPLYIPLAAAGHPQIFVGALGPNNQPGKW